MSSGFSGGSGGGGPEFYTAAGGMSARSIASAMSSVNGNAASQSPFRSQPQFGAGIFLEPNSQMAPQPAQPQPGLVGKRTLMEFQAQQQQQQHQHQHQHNQALSNLILRSVRSKISPRSSPISHLDFSAAVSSPDVMSSLSALSSPAGFSAQRYGLPILQQLRPQPIHLGNGAIHVSNQALGGVSFANVLQNRANPHQAEPENKMMNRLQELEKQLLDDDEEGDGDAVSVITNANSEWSETIQSLISPGQKQISPSPTSSSSSSSPSSSLSVPSPVPICSRQSLMEAATAIYEGRVDVASEILTRLSAVPNPKGNSEPKLMEYMLSALKSRVSPADNPPPVAELFTKDHVSSTQSLYELSPCFKLGFMAANLMILEAASEQPSTNKLHVIDFDVGQEGQYINLLHALSTRQPGIPSILKITTLADGFNGEERLRMVRDRLSELAAQIGVRLVFNIVSQKVSELSRDSLGCEPDEVLAVNLAFKLYRMPDESVSMENPRDELLRRVKGLAPRVVTLVEQEMNGNTAPFATRAGEALGYYGALLESLESTVPRDSSDRGRAEEGLSRKLGNSVACEGRDRVERCEVFGKWRARMGMAGFELKPLGQHVAESMKARLESGNRVNPGFTVKEENGGVCFGWLGRTLTVASAWR
ncbi:scarecrow-like protein 8 [Eucalyptus grandis]|uniref:scarecrow-like protein 8 n=1 Tax=Eucalyptus grandis TaxID=71139 RepID=UPI0001A68579|nr:scarecrow-like protein 8 [Eucalyptus grandis]